jgi:hypothetical protein
MRARAAIRGDFRKMLDPEVREFERRLLGTVNLDSDMKLRHCELGASVRHFCALAAA